MSASTVPVKMHWFPDIFGSVTAKIEFPF